MPQRSGFAVHVPWTNLTTPQTEAAHQDGPGWLQTLPLLVLTFVCASLLMQMWSAATRSAC